MADREQPPTPKMDAAALWREETYTDRKVGMIRRMIPVKPDGTTDMARKELFVGEASLMTPAGALPLSFEIPGDNLTAAVNGYGPALELALRDAMEELQEMRRKASQQIVIPQGGMPPVPPGKLKL